MDIRQVVHITLADEAPKIIDGYWHEWVNGEWVNTGVKATGEDGANFLIMGFWSDKIQYKLSPAGIPVVKLADSSQGGFSVYKLIAPESSYNNSTKKGTFVPSEWELIENVDFIYMQEAYIERLHAQQAVIAEFEILGDKLKSKYTKKVDEFRGVEILDDEVYADGSVTLSQDEFEIEDTITVTDQSGDSQRLIRHTIFNSEEISIKHRYEDCQTEHSIELSTTITPYGIFRDGERVL